MENNTPEQEEKQEATKKRPGRPKGAKNKLSPEERARKYERKKINSARRKMADEREEELKKIAKKNIDYSKISIDAITKAAPDISNILIEAAKDAVIPFRDRWPAIKFILDHAIGTPVPKEKTNAPDNNFYLNIGEGSLYRNILSNEAAENNEE